MRYAPARSAGLAAGAALALACHHKAATEIDALAPLLATADEAWDGRVDGGIDAAESALEAAFQAGPTDPRVLWRFARLHVERGLAETEPKAAIYDYATARSFAVSCLEGDPLFTDTRASEGWAAAAATVALPLAPCAAWAALSWTRWLEQVGPEAAALDLVAIDSLVAAGERGDEADTARWARGLLAAIRPEWSGRDLAAAKAALAAGGHAPGSVVRDADLLLRVALPTGDTVLRTTLCAGVGLSQESALTAADQAARSRALAACETARK